MSQFTDSELQKFKQQINTKIVTLESLGVASKEASDTVSLDQSKVGRLSRMDALQGQAIAKATAERRKQEIANLKRALVRIDDASFGECRTCEADIDPRRINHNPGVFLCLSCAEARETKT
ncbi:MAG: TraR/DksA family transcriptional regulator [Granulosicoccus sp.]